MPQRNFNIILFAVVISILCHFTYRSARTASIVGEAVDLIEQNYVDPIDRQKLVTAAMEGIVNQLDEHSSYFAVEAYEDFQNSMQQEFAGIGIYVDQPEAGTPVRVVTPLVNSPALRAGVMPNDLIMKVDGQDVSAMELVDVSDRLKGPPGTTVSLVVERESGECSMTVERATIKLESVVGDHRDADNHWVFRVKSEPSVAYIRLKSFGEKTVRELETVLRNLDNDFEALVLDLRGNGGGLLYAARDVSDMFISQGQIVSTRTRDGSIEDSYSATSGTLVDSSRPVAILIDENSASASEIVAACLQDNKRALIVGMRSYGKGTVQEVMPLQYGKSALRLTVARYYRPNNKNIHRAADAGPEDVWGVTPDSGFVIPMDRDEIFELSWRWRRASFPILEGLEPPQPTLSVDGGPEDGTGDEAIESAEAGGSSGGSPSEPEFEPVALSDQARENIERGPESIRFDPPLRAAVGRLLDFPPAERPEEADNFSKASEKPEDEETTLNEKENSSETPVTDPNQPAEGGAELETAGDSR